MSTNCDITSSFDGKHPFTTLNAFPSLLTFSPTGVVRIDECDATIKCIDLQACIQQLSFSAAMFSHALRQLIRVECCKSDEGEASDSSEIQALQAKRATLSLHGALHDLAMQIADGDVPRGVDIPIHMVLPRLFCCPSVQVSRFTLEFEMSVIVTFADVDGQPGIR